jgi:hypothetical protein
MVSGAVRPTEQISVGTREQLSTLYRLSLAEYLGSTIVLDDQLVQSDDSRMDWFRALLAEKARNFQILVFTCRPGDYLAKGALVPEGSAVHADTDGGFVRGCRSWSCAASPVKLSIFRSIEGRLVGSARRSGRRLIRLQ